MVATTSFARAGQGQRPFGITRFVGEHKLQVITIKRRNSKNGYTTPYEIYGPHEVIKALSDPGHWEKKCWITMYNKKFLLPTDYGTNDESTLKIWALNSQAP